MSNLIKVEYNTSVMVGAGWRSVEVTAIVELNKTGKKGEVKDVLLLDSEEPAKNMSRTGSKRQSYNGEYVASNQIGSQKIISKCNVID